VLLAAAPVPVVDVGAAEGADSGEGVTEVPAEEIDSPAAERPGVAAGGPTRVALLVGFAIPAEAGGVPVTVG
jgi:hypothetical protein